MFRMFRAFLLWSFISAIAPLSAQTDTEFWFAAPDLQTAHGDRPILLRISAGAQAATVTISIPANPGAGVQTVFVNANSSTSVNLTAQIDLIENGTPNTVMQKGLYISSTARVSIYYDINHNFNGDLYALKGRNALGTAFTVPMQTEFNNRTIPSGLPHTADLIIVATEDGTRVDVTCRNPLSGQPGSFSINLQRGETYVLTAPTLMGNQKPGGTIIRSNKPISISTKDDSIMLPGQTCADTAGDQLIPDIMTGTEYVITKGYLNISPDSYYVFATQNNTVIKVNGSVVTTLVNQGDHYIGRLTDPSCYLESDKPVQVFHITGIGCEVGGAIIPSIKCTGSTSVNVTRASATQNFYINVLAPSTIIGDFTVNGNNMLLTASSFTIVPGTGGKWSAARIQVPTYVAGTDDPVLVLNPNGKFHVGIIQGTQVNTTRYGYFSDFSINSIQLKVPGSTNEIFDTLTACYNTTAAITAYNQEASAYRWSGPNGFSSNSATLSVPNFDVRDTGLYKVTITAPGCGTGSDSIRLNIDKPRADLAHFTNGCENDNVKFIAKAPGMSAALWNFGTAGNSTSAITDTVKARFNQAGTITMRMRVKSPRGCLSDDTVHQFILSSVPLARYDVPAVTCVNKDLTFTDRSTITTGSIVRWSWDLADGNGFRSLTNNSAQTGRFATYGNKPVRLLVESQTGCLSDTFNLASFYVTPYPKPGFIVPEVCLDDANAVFTDTTRSPDGFNTFTYQWEFNTGATPVAMGPIVPPSEVTAKNPAVKYRKADDYQVKLTVDSRGCVESITQPFTVNGANPVPAFDILRPDTLCANDSVRIRNLSTVDFGVVTRLEILWDPTDPTRKTVDENPFVGKTYAWKYPDFQLPTDKPYNITLLAYSGNASSCSRMIMKSVTINASPKVTFNPLPGICLDAPARQITQTSYDLRVPSTVSYTGPGTDPGGLFHPDKANVGTHVIRYLAVSVKGCRDSAEQPLTVWPLPTAGFHVDAPVCEQNDIIFIDRSLANAGNITTWIWDYGDGSTPMTRTNGNAHTHKFTAWRNTTLRLQVKTDNGCASPFKDSTLQVHPIPRPAFDLPQACLPEARVIFMNNTTIPDGTDAGLSWRWTFDNAAIPVVSTLKDGPYTYFTKGSYPVKLIATSAAGCKDSLTQLFSRIYDQPKAGFRSADSACTDINLTFTDTSRAGTGAISEYFWDMGDGNAFTSSGFRHAYRSAGAWQVSLYANTSIGCRSDTARKTINVYAYPQISAGPDMFVLDDGQKQIQATATGTITGFQWSPVNYLSDPAILKPVIIRPQEDKSYTLTVTGRGGCISRDDMNMTVLRLPTPPNTFTPNGDGINDGWDVRYLDQYPGCVVEVFNTQGKMLFRSIGYQTPWDGRHNGNALPAGTYYYVIDPRNGRKKMAGYITILR
jgi:gliding motility-associated-like protein